MEKVTIDLRPTKVKTMKIWLNIYNDGHGYAYPTAEAALSRAAAAAHTVGWGKDAIAVAVPLEITY